MTRGPRHNFSDDLKKAILKRWRSIMMRWFTYQTTVIRLMAFNFEATGPSSSTSSATRTTKTSEKSSKPSTKDSEKTSVKDLMAKTAEDQYEEIPTRCLHEDGKKYTCSQGTFLECKKCGSRWKHMDGCKEWLEIPARKMPGIDAPSAQPCIKEHAAKCTRCREVLSKDESMRKKLVNQPEKSAKKDTKEEDGPPEGSGDCYSRSQASWERSAPPRRGPLTKPRNLAEAPPLDELTVDPDFMSDESVVLTQAEDL